MTPLHVRTVAAELRSLFRRPDLLIPLFDGSEESLSRGIAYYVVPKRRTNPRANWFLELPSIQRHKLSPPGMPLYGEVAYLLDLPRFLAQGLFPLGPYARTVHRLLAFLLPVVRQYDYVLATDLNTWQTNVQAHDEAFLTKEPLYVGSGQTVWDFDRWNDHLKKLIANEAFLRYATRSIQRSLELALLPKALRDLRQLTGEPAFLEEGLLLSDEDLSRSEHTTQLSLPERFHELPSHDGWAHVARYLIDGDGGADGCWKIFKSQFYGLQVLVDWAKLVELAYHQKRDSLLTSPLELGHNFQTAGVMARQSFDRVTGGRCTARRAQPLQQLVENVGVRYHDSTEQPWELYQVTALIDYVKQYVKRVARARIASQFTKGRGTEQRVAAVALDYVAPKYGETSGISVIRRNMGGNGPEFLFTIPYTLPKEYEDRRMWAKKRYRMRGTDYWTLRGLNVHANGVAGAPPIPRIEEAVAFRDWATAVSQQFSGRGWRKALHEQAYPKRVQEKLHGERRHLGFFSAAEDEELAGFFERREAGPLDAREKKILESVAPGRTVRAVLRRRDQLGFQYALKHGYAAYTRSGYCVQRSVLRRKRWMRLGVPA